METLKNWSIEFIYVDYIEKYSVGNTEYSSIWLRSVVLVSVH
jgi:hypothetical protein